MAFANYGELKTEVTARLGRSDLASRYDEFLALAHSRIYHGGAGRPELGVRKSDPLRIASMQGVEDVTINAERVSVPTSFLEARSFYIATDPRRELRVVPTSQLYSRFVGSTTGIPQVVAVEGQELVFGPAPDSTYTGKLLCYIKPAKFAVDTDTDWLLQNYPNLYLQGMMYEAGIAVSSSRIMSTVGPEFVFSVESLNESDAASQWGTGVKVQQVPEAP